MHQEIALELPECEVCGKQARAPRVHHLDFDRRVATFIVHRNFKQALAAANPPPQSP